MAALSHLKNKKESRIREGIDKVRIMLIALILVKLFEYYLMTKYITLFYTFSKIIQKSGASGGGPISVKNYMEVMDSYHVEFDKKEIAKLNRITDDDGFMERDGFLEYARKSSAIKEFTEKGAGGGGKTSTCKINKNMDKAELAFKVIIA